MSVKIIIELDLCEAKAIYPIIDGIVTETMKYLGEEVEDWYLPQNKKALDVFRGFSELEERLSDAMTEKK